MTTLAQKRTIFDAVILEPIELVISQPHQALISSASVFLVAAETASESRKFDMRGIINMRHQGTARHIDDADNLTYTHDRPAPAAVPWCRNLHSMLERALRCLRG